MSSKLCYISRFSDDLNAFIDEKRSLGCKYITEASILKDFDAFVSSSGYGEEDITKELYEQWAKRRPNEREKTRENRDNALKQFCYYLIRTGRTAYIPLANKRLRRDVSYRPHIYTDNETGRFLESTRNMSGSIQRKTVFYMLFSLLICTGLRLGEALRLKWKDIDLRTFPSTITVYSAKFDKDRIIPIAEGLGEQLSVYRQDMSLLFPNCEYLFPSKTLVPYSEHEVYVTFRKILWKAGISHGGKGNGPRIHDFRHSFAVKSLRKMVGNEENIMAVMPLLSQYLGHKDIYSTQDYLQFTAEMFPYVTETIQKKLGDIIPERKKCNEKAY